MGNLPDNYGWGIRDAEMIVTFDLSKQERAEQIARLFHVSDETMIDFGIATPEIIERVERRRQETRARWLALPWRVRLWRGTIHPAIVETRHRLAHAWRALRGVECERDW